MRRAAAAHNSVVRPRDKQDQSGGIGHAAPCSRAGRPWRGPSEIGDTHRISGESCCSESPSRFHGSHDLRRNLRRGHMWLIVLYSPALVLLPIALFVGIFFVLFSAGLFILLGSLYLLVMVFRGLIEFRNRRRWHG